MITMINGCDSFIQGAFGNKREAADHVIIVLRQKNQILIDQSNALKIKIKIKTKNRRE